MKRPDRIFVTCTAIIALTTLLFRYTGGDGTVVFQLIALNAWGILAHFTSGLFADRHLSAVLALALVLNLVAFLILALPLWVFLRNRAPKTAPVVIVCWSILYVALLFVLFPASDGP